MARDPKHSLTGADSINNLLPKRAPLSALPAPNVPAGSGALAEIDLDLLDDNPDQPRRWLDPDAVEELAASIRQRGTRQPDSAIFLRPAAGGRYFIIAGHRRRAAKLLLRDQAPAEERHLWGTIKAQVMADVGDAESGLIALEENIQRENLTPVEEGAAYSHLLETYPERFPSKKALAEQLGIDESRVVRMSRLNEAPEFLKDGIVRGILVADGEPAATTVDGDDSQKSTEKGRRTRRRLEYKAAVEFLRLYDHLCKQDRRNPVRAAEKAKERTTLWVTRALQEGWSVRAIEQRCTALIAGKEQSDSATRVAAPTSGGSPSFEQRGERVVLHLDRYRAAGQVERAEVRARLLTLLDAAPLTGCHVAETASEGGSQGAS